MENIISRLGIFVFFDPQGIVDQYVIQLLDAFRPNFSRLIVISNSKLDTVNSNLLKQHCNALFERENRGLDAGAFKDGMINFCGWEELKKYDEVVLINDTFFGPVHSFDKMFEEMSHRDIDFWGMSAGYPTKDDWNSVKYGYIPSHIQTFFVAFRNKMVCSNAFQDYWHSLDDRLDSFVAVVSQHETVMTKHFEELGFKWDIYADTKKFHSDYKTENFNIYYHHSYRMMKNMNFPVFKKKVLNADIPYFLYLNDLEEPLLALQYIQNESDYDVNLIWDNVLRLYNISDLYNTLHLNYILSSSPEECPMAQNAALLFHVINPFFVTEICSHALEISTDFDVYFLPGDASIAEMIRLNIGDNNKIHVIDTMEHQADMYGFLSCCRELANQYAYLGFIHDEINPEHYSATVPESTVFGYLQNAANDINYIKHLINCFETNPRLGVLGTPFPIHHYGFGNYGNEWASYFEETCSIAKSLGLKCKLEKDKLPIMLTGVFWCRTKAIQQIWKNDWKSFHFDRSSKTNEALRRILPYVAQSAGYYSGTVMHANYASMRITGQQYMLDQMVSVTRKRWGHAEESFIGYMKQIKISKAFLLKSFRIFLEHTTPPWFSQAIYNFYRWFKRRIKFLQYNIK